MSIEENRGAEDLIPRLKVTLNECDLEKKEMLLQALTFQYIYDGVVLTDMEGKIIDWNPAAERMFGFSRKEVMDKTIDIFLQPEDTPALSDEILKTIHENRRWSGEIEYIRKDGSLGICETIVVPLLDKDGRQIGSVGVSHDISKRKQMEKLFIDSERNFKDIFENATELIQSVDTKGHFLQVNKIWFETLEYSQDDLPDITLWDVIHPDHLEHCRKIFEKVFTGETIREVEVVFRSKSGREIPLEGNINSRVENGVVTATRGIFRDITKRKQAEERMKSAHDQSREANRKIKLAYEKMREWKDKLTFQLHEGEMGILIEKEGQIIGFSDMVMSITGLKRNELLGMTIFDLLDEESKKRFKDYIQKVSIGISQTISINLLRENSNHQAVEGKLMRIGIKNGKLFFVLLRDDMS